MRKTALSFAIVAGMVGGAMAQPGPSTAPPAAPPSAAPPAAPAPAVAPDPSMPQQQPGIPAPPPVASGPGSAPPAAVGPDGDPIDPDADPASFSDANATTSFLMPTALMPAAGSFGFHDYELLIIGGSYAPSNNLLFSLSTLVPLFDEQPFVGLASAKVQMYRGPSLRVAAHGALFFVTDEDGFTSGTLGAVATLCLNVECSTHVSGYAAAGLVNDNDNEVPLIFSGSLAARITDRVRFLTEVDTGVVTGEVNEVSDGFLLWYGLRFTSRHISGDIGFVKPIYEDADDELPIGLPVVSFTFRS